LSAGSLQTPKILFNSGIGPKSVLKAFGKPEIVVNEVIGQKIRNHQILTMSYYDPTLINPSLYATPNQEIEYAQDGTGWFGIGAAIMVVEKVNPAHPHDDVRINSQVLEGSTTPIYSQNVSITIMNSYNVYANGSLNLTSSNPLANSSFTANILVNQEDVDTIARGILKTRQIMAHYPHAQEIFPGPQYATLEQLYPVVKAHGVSVCHYYSSVPLGATSASPVDLRLHVRGVTKLRIVDASVVPGIISYGMQATAVVFGEKGASLIIEDYS